MEPAPAAPEARPKPAKHLNQDETDEQYRKAVAFCTVGLESVADYQLQKLLKPLLNLEKEFVTHLILGVQPW